MPVFHSCDPSPDLAHPQIPRQGHMMKHVCLIAKLLRSARTDRLCATCSSTYGWCRRPLAPAAPLSFVKKRSTNLEKRDNCASPLRTQQTNTSDAQFQRQRSTLMWHKNSKHPYVLTRLLKNCPNNSSLQVTLPVFILSWQLGEKYKIPCPHPQQSMKLFKNSSKKLGGKEKGFTFAP